MFVFFLAVMAAARENIVAREETNVSESAEASERLLDVVGSLELLAKDRTPAQASEELDPIVLQAFWREWPHASVWAGTLWRMLN